MSTLALWAGVILVSGVANWLTIDTSTVADHVLRLHSLFLGSDNSQIYIKSNDNNLEIRGWLVVWLGNSSESNAVVAGWSGNTIESNSDYSAIAWWEGNKVQGGKNSVIWWWKNNKIRWENAVILWWSNNNANTRWVVLGWNNNEASNNGVALWWQKNEAGTNSLAMWSWAKAASESFAWSATAENGEARIDAKSGVLINTWKAINWVNLLVNGMIKVWGNAITGDEQAWEIRFVNNCFYSYDGTGWHVMTTLTWWCNDISTKKSCQWGNVVLQHGDSATWYAQEFGTSCSGEKVWCDNGAVKNVQGIIREYSYCHKLTNS